MVKIMKKKEVTSNLIALLLLMVVPTITLAQSQQSRKQIDLSGKGWSLWLDQAAVWKHDVVHLPPVNISQVPAKPPTIGWKALHSENLSKRMKPGAIQVSVPGTVEEYYWGKIGGTKPIDGGDYRGVSWWSRTFTLSPKLKGKRITLNFASVNLVAEVYVNDQLVGYDAIGNTPFKVNITNAVKFGKNNRLDIRILDPVGDFNWNDNILMRWGENLVPAVHGFGGITGPLKLVATDKVRITDIYVQNQPHPKNVKVFVTLNNYTGTAQSGDLELKFHKRGKLAIIWKNKMSIEIPAGKKQFMFSAHVPDAKLWKLAGYKGRNQKHAAIYKATAQFTSNNNKIQDSDNQRFGFRWFDMHKHNGDMNFYLNGKRVIILSGMTRGFWPWNGIFPTPKMAKRSEKMLLKFGMNAIYQHRAIGQPEVNKFCDLRGIMNFEEPGGYRIQPNPRENIKAPDAKARKWRRIKLRRMIIRDRSDPSMIMYKLKNEATHPPNKYDKADMKMVHKLDPSRIINYNSGRRDPNIPYYKKFHNDPYALHMVPYDSTFHTHGWWDEHHWFAYPGYVDENYNNPHYYLRLHINAPRVPQPRDTLYSFDKTDIIFHGEEGAFGTMDPLGKIKKEIEEHDPRARGYREKTELDWYRYYNNFLDKSGFRKSYPTVDSLTLSMGRNYYYYQGRNIENVMISNFADAYNMNAWAGTATRTAIVDVYRNPTSYPSLISHYTQPLYIAVKLRNKVLPTEVTPIVDFYIVNRKNLHGKYALSVRYTNPKGKVIFSKNYQVHVAGGETYGQLLVEDVKLPKPRIPGHYKVRAILSSDGDKKASGFDTVFAVNIHDDSSIPHRIAVLEQDNIVKKFLKKARGVSIPNFSINENKLDVIVVGDYKFEELGKKVLNNLMKRVENGTKLIVLQNADKFAEKINKVLHTLPPIYKGGGIHKRGNAGRFFVGKSPYLTGLPQGEGMSWEYQCFYKTKPLLGRNGMLGGIALSYWDTDLIVALGNQGKKQILSGLSGVRVGKGEVFLSTLTMIPNLKSKNSSSVVAKKLFLNLLQY
jgi:hypothetical protein